MQNVEPCLCGAEFKFQYSSQGGECDRIDSYVCVNCGTQYKMYYTEGKLTHRKRFNVVAKNNKHLPTLCWSCKRSYLPEYRCSWAKEFKPVEGWEADMKYVLVQRSSGNNSILESYFVYTCPEYLYDGRS